MPIKKKISIISAFILIYAFSLNCAQAANLTISKIMYNPEGADTGREWVEVCNQTGAQIEIIGKNAANSWRFFDGKNHLFNIEKETIQAGECFIAAADSTIFSQEYPGFRGKILDTAMSLKNTSGAVKILDGSGNEIASAVYNNGIGADGNGKVLLWDGNVWKESANQLANVATASPLPSAPNPTPSATISPEPSSGASATPSPSLTNQTNTSPQTAFILSKPTPKATKSPIKKSSPKQTINKIDNQNSQDKMLAGSGETLPDFPKKISFYIIPIALALISATIMVVLKIKTKPPEL